MLLTQIIKRKFMALWRSILAFIFAIIFSLCYSQDTINHKFITNQEITFPIGLISMSKLQINNTLDLNNIDKTSPYSALINYGVNFLINKKIYIALNSGLHSNTSFKSQLIGISGNLSVGYAYDFVIGGISYMYDYSTLRIDLSKKQTIPANNLNSMLSGILEMNYTNHLLGPFLRIKVETKTFAEIAYLFSLSPFDWKSPRSYTFDGLPKEKVNYFNLKIIRTFRTK